MHIYFQNRTVFLCAATAAMVFVPAYANAALSSGSFSMNTLTSNAAFELDSTVSDSFQLSELGENWVNQLLSSQNFQVVMEDASVAAATEEEDEQEATTTAENTSPDSALAGGGRRTIPPVFPTSSDVQEGKETEDEATHTAAPATPQPSPEAPFQHGQIGVSPWQSYAGEGHLPHITGRPFDCVNRTFHCVGPPPMPMECNPASSPVLHLLLGIILAIFSYVAGRLYQCRCRESRKRYSRTRR